MHLNSLTVSGFKSFGDRVTIHFRDGITAIIGPNGSGKSNLIDALRWACGGGRASSYRASDKTDLIFHGAAGKRSLGRADVEIELREPPGSSRIVIQRSLHRDGSGRLRLNGQAARFLDIEEALHGTGLGPGNLAVVSQGEISGVLTADPARLLEYVAEAADVARLSHRRDLAAQRLASARSHLERLGDLLAELTRLLDDLREEAQTAARHQELARRVLQLRFTAGYRRHRGLQREVSTLEGRIAELEGDLETVKADGRLLQDGFAQARTDLVRQESSYREALALSEKRRGDLRVAEERARGARERLESLHSRREDVGSEIAALRRQPSPEAPEDDPEALAAAAAASGRELAQASARGRELEREERERRAVLTTLRARAAQEEAALAAARSRREQLLGQQQEVAEQLAALDNAPQGEDAATEEDGYRKARRAFEEGQEQLEDLRTSLQQLQERQAGLAAESRALHRAAERARAAFERRQAFAEGPRRILQANLPGVLGAVADLLDVERPYRTAIAAALGRRAEYIVIAGSDLAGDILDRARREGGYVTLLPLDLVEADAPRETLAGLPGVVGLAAARVTTEPRFAKLVHRLLGSTTLVADLQQAIALARSRTRRPRLVTLEGDIVEAYGAVSGGRRRTTGGVLGAAADLEEAETAASEANDREAAAGEEVRQKQQTFRERQALQESRGVSLARQHERALRLRQASEERTRRKAELVERQERLMAGLAAAGLPEVSVAPGAIARLETELERAREGREVQARSELELQARAREADTALVRSRERHQAYRQLLEGFRRGLERLGRLEAQALELQGALGEAKRQHGAAEERRAEAAAAVPSDLGAKEAAYRRAAEDVERSETLLARQAERQAALATDLEAARVTLARRQAALELAAEQLREFPSGLAPLELVERAARQQLAAAEEELEGLGPVNHRANQEYARQAGRLEELEVQAAQGVLAVAELETALRRLDGETTGRIQGALARLQGTFLAYVTTLFGPAAQAELRTISDEGRPVGLEIHLTPPGKQTRDLNLLSVGERTMGALAFLFALMTGVREGSRRGLPLAVLDEVDAPLDESNIRRYCSFLRRLARDGTQFVLITHQKATFEVADAIWGVTTDQGVSRVFSIRNQEAAAVS